MIQERHYSTEFDLWVTEQRVLFPDIHNKPLPLITAVLYLDRASNEKHLDQVLNLMYLAFQAGQKSPK